MNKVEEIPILLKLAQTWLKPDLILKSPNPLSPNALCLLMHLGKQTLKTVSHASSKGWLKYIEIQETSSNEIKLYNSLAEWVS